MQDKGIITIGFSNAVHKTSIPNLSIVSIEFKGSAFDIISPKYYIDKAVNQVSLGEGRRLIISFGIPKILGN